MQLRAIDGFVRHAPPRRLHRWRESLVRQLTSLAPALPDDVAVTLLRVHAPEPATVPSDVLDGVERAWIVQSIPEKFDRTWDALARMLSPTTDRGAQLLTAALHATVREIGPQRVSQGFRRGASRRLQHLLSRPVSPAADGAALQLFELVALPDAGGYPPAYWQCVLGDRARQRGEDDEAIRRYRAALQGNQAQARPRLADQLALKGHRLLRRGEFSPALEHLRAAESLNPDPEYRLLSLIGQLLSRPGAAGEVVSDLTGLRGQLAAPATADFWVGVAQLESGDHAGAAATLRRSFGTEPADPDEGGGDQVGPLATLLLQVAEGGEDGLVALARELLHRHADRWAQRSPLSPDALVADAADRDPALLSRLVSALPDHGELTAPTRTAAAHAMLRSAMRASEAGIALNRLELAERLLQGG